MTATDSVGNTTTKSASYSVGYSFSGFFGGISSTALNGAKSGDTVAMPFSLNGNFGLSVLAAGQPVAIQINCTTRATIGSASPTLGFLAYAASTTLYTYSWNTQTAWKKLCIRFSMTLKDGTTHSADFQFR